MAIQDLLEKVTDEPTRKAIKEEYDRVNRERGSFGDQLIQKDNALRDLQSQNVEYGKAYEILKNANIKAEEIPKLLEKMKVTKTIEDEYKLTKNILSVKEQELQEALKKANRLLAEKHLGKILDDERKNLKDAKGQAVRIADDLINFDSLYDGITDFTNEAVLKEKAKAALNEALAKQASILEKIGFQGAAVHKLPSGDQTHAAAGITGEDLKTVSKEKGQIAAIHAYRKAKANAQ